jgi:hypothetical protein
LIWLAVASATAEATAILKETGTLITRSTTNTMEQYGYDRHGGTSPLLNRFTRAVVL